MARSTKSFFSGLAVLAAASAAHAQEQPATELLRTAQRAATAVSHCETAAEDLVGDVALRIWSRHRKVLEGGDFTRYVETSVRNARCDQIRRRGRSRAFSELARSDQEADVEKALEPIVPASEDVHSLFVTEEFRDALSPRDRDVLQHLEEGRSDRQIARLLGETRHQVRSSVCRIREHARVFFGDEAPAALPSSS